MHVCMGCVCVWIGGCMYMHLLFLNSHLELQDKNRAFFSYQCSTTLSEDYSQLAVLYMHDV